MGGSVKERRCGCDEKKRNGLKVKLIDDMMMNPVAGWR